MDRDTHFDAIVVGSGFGGSVSAYRLAEAGQRVCVLERGKAYPPQSFARSPREMSKNFWDPSRGLHGLFNIWSFRAIEAVVASGLGGGSLIYANVLIRKDERWFVDEEPFGGGYEHWPISRADLEPHYDEVERMLRAQPYPLASTGYDDTAKTIAMREAAQALGLEWQLPKLAVTFANDDAPPRPGEPIPPGPYPNLHGPHTVRTTCRLSGECNLGCNYGSKNTLDHTYLSAAEHLGADIRTRCEVRRFEPLGGGGFSVSYVEHHPDREGKRTKTNGLPLVTITADRLILAAGTLGTTYLLLRNRSSFPAIGAPRGTRFCGNGDVLGLLLRSRGGSPDRPTQRVLDASRGTVITSFMRLPDGHDPEGAGRGGYIEDAGFPGFVDWMLETTTLPNSPGRVLRFALRRLWGMVARSPQSDLSAEIANLIGTTELSSGSLPLLGMGRDVPDGVIGLRKGHLDVNWNMATSQAFFEPLRQTMRDIADQLGATYRDSPLRTLKRLITVHPLGGCPMGRHDKEGVVDEWGQVFHYPGLYVADGAAMPGPVGPNPALTIAAFADRVTLRILDEKAAVVTDGAVRVATMAAGPAGPLLAAPGPSGPSERETPGPSGPSERETSMPGPATSLSFTEEMKGYVTLGELEFKPGFEAGKDAGTFLMFHLTIETDDVDRFIADPRHPASARGWVDCEQLGGRLPVEEGFFNLFVDTDDPSLTRMLYRLFLTDAAGDQLTLTGFKEVRDDPGFDLWSDTSTLYTRVLRGHVTADDEPAAEVVASGIINIYLQDFAKQLTTFRTRGPSPAARAKALSDFGRLFLGQLWDTYAPLAGE